MTDKNTRNTQVLRGLAYYSHPQVFKDNPFVKGERVAVIKLALNTDAALKKAEAMNLYIKEPQARKDEDGNDMVDEKGKTVYSIPHKFVEFKRKEKNSKGETKGPIPLSDAAGNKIDEVILLGNGTEMAVKVLPFSDPIVSGPARGKTGTYPLEAKIIKLVEVEQEVDEDWDDVPKDGFVFNGSEDASEEASSDEEAPFEDDDIDDVFND